MLASVQITTRRHPRRTVLFGQKRLAIITPEYRKMNILFTSTILRTPALIGLFACFQGVVPKKLDYIRQMANIRYCPVMFLVLHVFYSDIKSFG